MAVCSQNKGGLRVSLVYARGLLDAGAASPLFKPVFKVPWLRKGDNHYTSGQDKGLKPGAKEGLAVRVVT